MSDQGDPLAGGAGSRGARRAIGKRRRRWPWVVVTLVLAVGAVGAWLGVRVFQVKTELEGAQAAVAQAQAGGDLTDALTSIKTHSAAAMGSAADPVWRVSEVVPWVGNNLKAARVTAEALNLLSADLALPTLGAASSGAKTPALARIADALTAAAPRAMALHGEAVAVQARGGLVPQISGRFGQVVQVLEGTAWASERLPDLVGMNGARNYLLLAQNNAEAIGIGGATSSITEIRLLDGKASIAKQATGGDFKVGIPPGLKMDASAVDLFGHYLVDHVAVGASRPDFPTAAQTALAFWRRDISAETIHGVGSMDPIGLAKIFRATGPVTMSSGEVVTSENLVKVVLSDIYAAPQVRFNPAVGDEFYKELARKAFTKVSGFDFEFPTMLAAVREGIANGNLMFWSPDAEIQKVVAASDLGGILPAQNQPNTTVGVFFREASGGAKIDYYMKSTVKVVTSCTADNRPQWKVTVGLHLDITKAQAEQLPLYVQSQLWRATRFQTQIFVYGPPGSTVEEVTKGPGVTPWRDQTLSDLGRPTPSFVTVLKPAGKTSVTTTFTGVAKAAGPVKVRLTPMVQPTDVSVTGSGCR